MREPRGQTTYPQMDPTKIEPLITPRTVALPPTHHWGGVCDMEQILAVARRHNLKVVEDCAQSPGGKYRLSELEAAAMRLHDPDSPFLADPARAACLEIAGRLAKKDPAAPKRVLEALRDRVNVVPLREAIESLLKGLPQGISPQIRQQENHEWTRLRRKTGYAEARPNEREYAETFEYPVQPTESLIVRSFTCLVKTALVVGPSPFVCIRVHSWFNGSS